MLAQLGLTRVADGEDAEEHQQAARRGGGGQGLQDRPGGSPARLGGLFGERAGRVEPVEDV